MSNRSQENNTDVASSQGEKIIDVSAIFSKYKRYWWLFVLSLITCIGLAVVFLNYKLPEYLVISTVLVDQDDDGSSAGASLLKSLSLGGAGSSVDDEVVVMGSQDICCKMVKELKLNRLYVQRKGLLKKEDLYKNSPIEIDAPEEVFDTLSVGLSFKVTVKENGKADIKVKKGMFKTLTTLSDQPLPSIVTIPYGSYVVKTTNYYKPGKEIVIVANVTGNLLRTEQFMEDMTVNDDSFEIFTEPNDFAEVADALRNAGYELLESDIDMVPTMTSEPPENVINNLKKLVAALEDDDDVQKVYTNCDVDLDD